MAFNFVRIRSVGVSGLENLRIEAQESFKFQLDSETDQGRAEVVRQWVADGAEEGPTCCMHRRRPSQALQDMQGLFRAPALGRFREVRLSQFP